MNSPDPAATGRVTLRDVTLRDGLQDESPIAMADKLALYSALVVAGVDDLELTSFVRADRVPAMADADELAAATADPGGPTRWGLVLNRRGAERALAAGLRNVQFVVSVSDAHNRNNAGRPTAGSLEDLGQIVELADADGAAVEVTLATAFGCPHTGPVDPADVRRAADHAARVGVRSIGLADTIGTAIPTEVTALVRNVAADHPDLPVGIHLHDTRGLAVTNALAAIDAGAVRVDGSVGGLGGCPFAPGASGNLALEDLAHVLAEMGVATGVDVERLIEAAELACRLVGRPVASHVGVAGPRFKTLSPLDATP
ncbi:hydroxymethylglutaryl-CoA lyase [Desertimonas flava]|uniref:hydroxymethylglutaryl-CoA lyase n=1 Tax=Desertimonas flava TaxID=2064846 RepID=UPI0013C40FF3|nr:hydroxymethylglutaryl-CoA lyase [Desertimonas flava]